MLIQLQCIGLQALLNFTLKLQHLIAETADSLAVPHRVSQRVGLS